jgi:hypothetical protein
MTSEERAREDTLYEIRVQEFTHAMRCHGCPGEDVYYRTELLVMWEDIGYGVDHGYLLN